MGVSCGNRHRSVAPWGSVQSLQPSPVILGGSEGSPRVRGLYKAWHTPGGDSPPSDPQEGGQDSSTSEDKAWALGS